MLAAQVALGAGARSLTLSVGGAIIPVTWLTKRLVLASVLAAILVLGLVGALALGWNSPRLRRQPDWEPPWSLYRVKVAPGATTLSLLHRPGRDFAFEVTGLPFSDVEGGFYDFGLVYRAQDLTHYYVFAVGTDGYYGVLKVNGEQTTPLVPWRQLPHVRRGRRSNRLFVMCTGSSCGFRINDEYAVTVDDDTWLSGQVGLWARGQDEKVVVQFNAARAWTLDGRPGRRSSSQGSLPSPTLLQAGSHPQPSTPSGPVDQRNQ